jgi:hypothetical protein
LESIAAGRDCAVLRIDGEIDADAAPRICERVTGLARNGTIHIIADLRGAGSSTRPAWAPWWAATRGFAPAGDR